MDVILRNVAARQILRSFHRTPIYGESDPHFQVPKRVHKLKNNQRKFQVEDCAPVYLKAGFKDKVMYNGCLVGLLVGMGMSVEVILKLILK